MTKAQSELLNLCDIPPQEVDNPIALIKRIGVIESRLLAAKDSPKPRKKTTKKTSAGKAAPVTRKKGVAKLLTKMRSTRERYGLSREVFATFVGCHVQTLYAWETGRGKPSENSQEQIRQAIRAVEKNRLSVAEQKKEERKVAASPAGAAK